MRGGYKLIKIVYPDYNRNLVILTLQKGNRTNDYSCNKKAFIESGWHQHQERRVKFRNLYSNKRHRWFVFVSEISDSYGRYYSRPADFRMLRRVFYDEEEVQKI